jgi:hypothetical protein
VARGGSSLTRPEPPLKARPPAPDRLPGAAAGAIGPRAIVVAPDPLAHSVLDGRYRLGEPVGRGGMGVVYRALDTKLERPVAVKLLSEAGAANRACARGTGHLAARLRGRPRAGGTTTVMPAVSRTATTAGTARALATKGKRETVRATTADASTQPVTRLGLRLWCDEQYLFFPVSPERQYFGPERPDLTRWEIDYRQDQTTHQFSHCVIGYLG